MILQLEFSYPPTEEEKGAARKLRARMTEEQIAELHAYVQDEWDAGRWKWAGGKK